MASIPPSSMEPGDRRLAYATAMCVAEAASVELPLAREDHYRAWSAMGGDARLVRIRYPHRLGYGMQPFAAIGVGLILTFAGIWGGGSSPTSRVATRSSRSTSGSPNRPI